MANQYIFIGKKSKGKVRHIYVDDSGNKCSEVVPYHARVYEYQNKESDYKDVTGNPVTPIEVNSVKDYVEQWENVQGHSYCGDMHEINQFTVDKYPGELAPDISKIPICYFDIEVVSTSGFPYPDEALYEVISIAMYMSNTKKTTVLGSKENYIPKNENVTHHYYKNESDLLTKFWSMMSTDVCMLVGWNSDGFDIPYLVNRSKNIGVDFEQYLPTKHIRDSFHKKANQRVFAIDGIITYDYMLLYKNFNYSNEDSYSLDHISKKVLGAGKVEYIEHNTIQKLYEEDYQKFIDYNNSRC